MRKPIFETPRKYITMRPGAHFLKADYNDNT